MISAPVQAPLRVSPAHRSWRPLGLAKMVGEDFPGGPVVKRAPDNAGNAALIPGWRRPRSLFSTTSEPVLSSPRAQLLKPGHPTACPLKQEKPLQQEARSPQLESSPHLPKAEKAHTQQRRPSAVKNQLILKRDIKKLSGMKHIDI